MNDVIERIRKWLGEQGYDGILLGRRDNYTWVTQGAKNHVVSNQETGVAYFAILPHIINIIADTSDLPRMEAEQNPDGAEGIQVPWYESMEDYLRKYIDGKNFVSDTGICNTKNVQEELVDLRMILNPAEVTRYQEAGQVCAGIVEGVCMNARPGQSESEIEAMVKDGCIRQGVSPDCVLVGADSRILSYRHPMPTERKIEKSLMVVLGGEKYGLNISMTRMVYFADVPQEIQKRYQKTQYVFACMQLLMKEGLAYQDYFRGVMQLYKEAGYEKEWKMHHQGGPAGYACREYVVTPNCGKAVHMGQAYAWNPTIQGTKCEETTYLDKNGIAILTRTGKWPCTVVATPYGQFETADILV